MAGYARVNRPFEHCSCGSFEGKCPEQIPDAVSRELFPECRGRCLGAPRKCLGMRPAESTKVCDHSSDPVRTTKAPGFGDPLKLLRRQGEIEYPLTDRRICVVDRDEDSQ